MSRAPACLIAFALLSLGCSVTHPRVASSAREVVSTPCRIAILRPAIEASVKYYRSKQFLQSPKAGLVIGTGLSIASRRFLESLGHTTVHDVELQALVTGGKRRVRRLNASLHAILQRVIIADLDYSHPAIAEEVAAEGVVPPELRGKVDLLVAMRGTARLETERETRTRWIRNITFNVLTFPFTLASSLLPFPTPLSVTISTQMFERSPDRCFVSAVVVDCRTNRILFLNDYSHESVPRKDGEHEALVKKLLTLFEKIDD